jgi:hypothetical protein
MPPAKSSQDKFKFKFKFKSSQSRFSRYGVRPRVPDPAPAPRAPDERGKIHQKYEPPNPRGARGRMAGAARPRGAGAATKYANKLVSGVTMDHVRVTCVPPQYNTHVNGTSTPRSKSSRVFGSASTSYARLTIRKVRWARSSRLRSGCHSLASLWYASLISLSVASDSR